MDSLIQEVLVVVVEDVLVSETPCRSAGATVPPVVMVIRDVKVALIDIAKSIRVSNQRGFPVVVEIVPGDGDPVACADDVALTIVVVRTMVQVRTELVVINPHSSTVLDGDPIIVQDEADAEVANDHIVDALYRNTVSSDLGAFAFSNYTLVASNVQSGCEIERPVQIDNRWGVAFDSCEKRVLGSYRHCLASFASGGRPDGVVFAKSNEAKIRFARSGTGKSQERGERGKKRNPHNVQRDPKQIVRKERRGRDHIYKLNIMASLNIPLDVSLKQNIISPRQAGKTVGVAPEFQVHTEEPLLWEKRT